MDGLILMGESLCRVDSEVSLHVTVPEAPASVQAWAERTPKVVLSTRPPDGVSGWDVKPWLLLQELNAGWPAALWLDADMIVTRPISSLLKEFPHDSLIVAQEWDCLWDAACRRSMLASYALRRPTGHCWNVIFR
jgi:ABC-type uncharacterized transport system YnjBCD substrate-binding protein